MELRKGEYVVGVQTYEVRRKCVTNNCGGEMQLESGGLIKLKASGPKFSHKCSVCGCRAVLDGYYPRIEKEPLFKENL